MASVPLTMARAFIRGVSSVIDRSATEVPCDRADASADLERSWRKVGDAIADATGRFDKQKNQNGNG